MDNRAAFSERLKCLRMGYGLSPKDFATRLNFKLQAYYTYENGRAVPGYDGLIKIAQMCNVSLDWLCGISPIQNRKTGSDSFSMTESGVSYIQNNDYSQASGQH